MLTDLWTGHSKTWQNTGINSYKLVTACPAGQGSHIALTLQNLNIIFSLSHNRGLIQNIRKFVPYENFALYDTTVCVHVCVHVHVCCTRHWRSGARPKLHCIWNPFVQNN